jgi:hypothetical protein
MRGGILGIGLGFGGSLALFAFLERRIAPHSRRGHRGAMVPTVDELVGVHLDTATA